MIEAPIGPPAVKRDAGAVPEHGSGLVASFRARGGAVVLGIVTLGIGRWGQPQLGTQD